MVLNTNLVVQNSLKFYCCLMFAQVFHLCSADVPSVVVWYDFNI